MHAVGPVFIRCVTNDMYLNVIGVSHLRASSKKCDASEFYLKPSGNPKHPEEFYICYFGSKHTRHNHHLFRNDETDNVEDAKRVPQYLQTPVNILGSNPGPLEFGYHIRDKETRLVLQSSVRKHHQPPVSLSAWMSGSEICFIQCARRRRNSYLAVKHVQSDHSTHTCCVPSKRDSSASTLYQIVQKWEARVDNLMNAKEPLHEEYASYGIVPKRIAAPRQAAKILPVCSMEDNESISSNEEESEERDDNCEEVSHEDREHKTIPNKHMQGRAVLKDEH